MVEVRVLRCSVVWPVAVGVAVAEAGGIELPPPVRGPLSATACCCCCVRGVLASEVGGAEIWKNCVSGCWVGAVCGGVVISAVYAAWLLTWRGGC